MACPNREFLHFRLRRKAQAGVPVPPSSTATLGCATGWRQRLAPQIVETPGKGLPFRRRACSFSVVNAGLRILAFHELASPLAGADHSFDQRDTQSAFLELQQTVDGATSRRGYNILQFGGMLARLQHHRGCP